MFKIQSVMPDNLTASHHSISFLQSISHLAPEEGGGKYILFFIFSTHDVHKGKTVRAKDEKNWHSCKPG